VVVANALNELKQAARALAKRPGYAVVAALTLALGIAANVAIFTLVDAILLRPLPYPEASRIVTVTHHAPGLLDLPALEMSPGLVDFYRERQRPSGTGGRGERLAGSVRRAGRQAGAWPPFS
jgi:hypothetical protein